MFADVADSKKKVLVIGGTRYIGPELLTMLRKESTISAIGTVSRSDEKHDHTIHFIGDRKNRQVLHQILNNFQPNIIIDMVCFDGDDVDVIIDAFDKAYLTCLEHYIVVSTFFVYNLFDIDDFREKPLDDLGVNNDMVDSYTLGKIALENRLNISPLMAVSSILRLPFVFSSDDYTGRFQKICALSSQNNNSILDGGFRFSMISKTFAAAGINYLATHEPVGITDYASSGCLNSHEISQIIMSSNKMNFEQAKKESVESPYSVSKDICCYSKKIPLYEDVEVAIKREAIVFFRSLYDK